MTEHSREFLELQAALKGRYSLERELGRGGMGVVYLAHEVALDRPVALKLLPVELAEREDLRERFLREARTAARLSHPHIVPIFTVDEVDRFVFFAMAWVDGESLGERVRRQGPLSPADATRLMKEVAWALAYAHAQGVVHRDVKPDNILLEKESGRAMVTDFGIAVAGHEEGRSGTTGVVGTAEFMSPEQAAAGDVDARSDLYSLGAVGFYAVSGRFPFEGETASEVLAAHVSTPAPPVASVVPDLPGRLARVVDRCLRKEPGERFPDGEALADALSGETAVDRAVPVPLRVFIKRLRETSRRGPVFLSLLLLFFGPTLAVMTFASGSFVAGALLLGLFAAFGVIPAASAAYHARKLLKGGYRLEDARHALERDVERRTEELTFEYGLEHTWVDRLLTVGGVGGLGLAVILAVAMVVLGTEPITLLMSSLIVGLFSGVALRSRDRRRRDIVGEKWLKVLRGRRGEWIFDLAGLGLDPTKALGSPTYRPTEMALGLAAGRLFEELPKDVRRSLSGLPDVVRRLEADARELRVQVAELDEVLDEIGEEGTERVGSEERERVRKRVAATRDAARERLTETVSALETIRLGLLRLHAGDATVASVTAELEAAGEVSADMKGLLEGRREVEVWLEGEVDEDL